jgi:hypothetical protein
MGIYGREEAPRKQGFLLRKRIFGFHGSVSPEAGFLLRQRLPALSV